MKRPDQPATASRRLTALLPSLIGPDGLTTSVVINRLTFVIIFVGAKVVALFGMLWLARTTTPEIFGGVELSLSVAVIATGVGLLGIPGGVTRLALALDEPHVVDLLSFAALCVAAPTTMAAVVGLVVGWPPVWVLALACCAAACVQMSASTYARIRARPLFSSVVDPFAVLSILALAAVLSLTGVLTLASLAAATTVLACLLCIGLLWNLLRSRRAGFLAAYKRALKISLPILAFSGVAMMVGAGLRPLLGLRFSLEELALYALCFRLCAPCMLFQQLLGTAFFARLYRSGDRDFDLVVAGLAVACVLTVIAVWLCLPVVVSLAFPTYQPALPGLAVVFPLVGLQVVYWILIAMMEMKVGRHAVAASTAVAGYAIFAIFGLALFALPIDNLVRMTALFDLALAAFAAAQFILLRRRGVNLPLIAAAIPLAALTCGLLVWAA